MAPLMFAHPSKAKYLAGQLLVLEERVPASVQRPPR
jgi:hypothetical protein